MEVQTRGGPGIQRPDRELGSERAGTRTTPEAADPLAGADPSAFHLLLAGVRGEPAGTGLAFHCAGEGRIASLQSTGMAERLSAPVGFRELGRFPE